MTSRILSDYIKELKGRNALPIKLAFNHFGHEILVWAVIEDDNEDMEDGLFRAETVINAKHSDTNYALSTTILEESDNLDIPNHYVELACRNFNSHITQGI